MTERSIKEGWTNRGNAVHDQWSPLTCMVSHSNRAASTGCPAARHNLLPPLMRHLRLVLKGVARHHTPLSAHTILRQRLAPRVHHWLHSWGQWADTLGCPRIKAVLGRADSMASSERRITKAGVDRRCKVGGPAMSGRPCTVPG